MTHHEPFGYIIRWEEFHLVASVTSNERTIPYNYQHRTSRFILFKNLDKSNFKR